MSNDSVSFAVTQSLNVSTEAIWKVLGDFGTEHRWTKSVRNCVRDTPYVSVGTKRTCTLPKPLMGRTEARETLTEFVLGKTLAYELEGSAGPFLTASSRWSTIEGRDQTTLLTVEGRFTTQSSFFRILLWPMVRPMLKRLTSKVMRELENYCRQERERPR